MKSSSGEKLQESHNTQRKIGHLEGFISWVRGIFKINKKEADQVTVQTEDGIPGIQKQGPVVAYGPALFKESPIINKTSVIPNEPPIEEKKIEPSTPTKTKNGIKKNMQLHSGKEKIPHLDRISEAGFISMLTGEPMNKEAGFAEMLSGSLSRSDAEKIIKEKEAGLPLAPKTKKELLGSYPAPQEELDLHQKTTSEAENGFNLFFWAAKKSKLKTIRVITGKGLHSEDGKSILREWMNEKIRMLKKGKQIVSYEWEKGDISKSGAVILYLP